MNLPPKTRQPPSAARRPHTHIEHGNRRDDPWHWLRDDSRSDPQVLAYLEAENDYARQVLAPAEPLRQRLLQEMISRVVRDDASVPVQRGAWFYFHRYRGDQEHPVYLRSKNPDGAEPEMVLDANERAKGHEYYQLGAIRTSDDHRLLAFSEDTVGRRQYTLRVRDLAGGQYRDNPIDNTSGALAWSADGEHLFYVRRHPVTLLPCQVWRHRIGTASDDDVLCLDETDPAFHATVYRSMSGHWIYIHLASTLSDEVWLLPANDPTSRFRCFHRRERGHEYSVADAGGQFFIRSNWQADNFRLLACELESCEQRETWRELLPASDDVLLEDFEAFRDHLVINERREGLLGLRVFNHDGEPQFAIEGGVSPSTAELDHNVDTDAGFVRIAVSAMTTPRQVWDVSLDSGERRLRKQTRVPGPFDAELYASKRLAIAARDGAMVPVSLVYRKDLGELTQRPLLVYGYGAYGHCVDPRFSQSRLSLLDRGMIFAIAHVRGGEDLGRRWYDAGRTHNKPTTFHDFIDVAKGLPERGFGDRRRICAMGGSAGGLLVGAAANLAPEVFYAMVAQVPFVDVVTTMLDEEIPLTTGEFDEWGNPAVASDYAAMLAWSPYDQVRAQDYPHLLVTTGLHDSQVQYWEPAKWTARLRVEKTDDHLLLLHTNMSAGHSGASGRYQQFEEISLEYGFLLWLVDTAGQKKPPQPEAAGV